MKRLLLSIFIVFMFSTTLYAAPFLVCDPQISVTHYNLTGDKPWVPATSPAIVDGSLKLDVATSVVGTTNMTVKACIADAIWGERCSTTVPFVLTRPGLPTAPSNARLVP